MLEGDIEVKSIKLILNNETKERGTHYKYQCSWLNTSGSSDVATLALKLLVKHFFLLEKSIISYRNVSTHLRKNVLCLLSPIKRL